jgi:hypothetical protein
VKPPAFEYRFKLSDREFAAAWLRGYYRRPGARVLRVLAGPALVALGGLMRVGQDSFARVMGLASIALGLWLTLKPLLMLWSFLARRRRRRSGDAELRVSLDASGLRVTDDDKTVAVPWSKIASAGVDEGHVWLELSSGSRATIPRRAIDDLESLRDLLRSRTRLT